MKGVVVLIGVKLYKPRMVRHIRNAYIGMAF